MGVIQNSESYKYERAKMKTHLIVDIFEMHILYRNGCQKYYMHRGQIVRSKGGGGYLTRSLFSCKGVSAQSIIVYNQKGVTGK